ncbi:hypothetical protein ACN08N_19770 [Photobacterium leiognathi subsp. mandapamensis]|uniref:hypothetical protein n=1 Tax=Photobacterium leiognathi TaxID=553611 RepID=UPI003AF371FC
MTKREKKLWTGYNWFDVIIRIAVLLALVYVAMMIKDFFAVDACLDAGNSFNYDTDSCEMDV